MDPPSEGTLCTNTVGEGASHEHARLLWWWSLYLKDVSDENRNIPHPSQKENAQLKAEGRLHLVLRPAGCPSRDGASYMQLVSITPPPVPTADEIAKIQLCQTFAVSTCPCFSNV